MGMGTAFSTGVKVSHDTKKQMLVRQSQRCPRDCSGVLALALLEEVQGLLSRFVSVYSGCITQGGAGVGLAGCYEPPCQVRLFSRTSWLAPTLIDDTRERNSAVQRKCYLVFFDTFTLQFHKFTK
jgi:hypothetical protein